MNELKRGRKNAHMKQRELADILGVSRQLVSDWECGRQPIHSRHRLILVGTLAIEPELLDWTDNEPGAQKETKGPLWELRKASGLTCLEVADMLGVSERTLREWETGESNVKPGYIQAIIEVYDEV